MDDQDGTPEAQHVAQPESELVELEISFADIAVFSIAGVCWAGFLVPLYISMTTDTANPWLFVLSLVSMFAGMFFTAVSSARQQHG